MSLATNASKRTESQPLRWASRTLIAAVLVLGACATGDGVSGDTEDVSIDEDGRLGVSVSTVCFSGRLSGFNAEGAHAIVLRRTLDDAYLVRTGYCPTLRRVEAIGLPEPSRCISRGDELFVSDTVFNDREDLSDQSRRCRIMSIHRWDEDAGAPEGEGEPRE